jgi:murein DD-endopeptidase MepM/ murein hydrolase activator NlpD
MKFQLMKAPQQGGSQTRSYFAPLTWLIILALLLGPALPARAQTTGPIYIVQEGDSLFSIALAFGVSVEDIQTANNIADPTLISVGQEVVIPGFENVSGTLLTYKVQLGETLPGLAKRFGASLNAMVLLNRLTATDALYVGQSLIYPSSGTGIPAGHTWVGTKNNSIMEMAARTNHSPWALALLNNLKSPYELYSGQHIVVPGDPELDPPLSGLPSPFETLTLRPDRPIQGGTLEIVARMTTGVTLEGQFAQWPLRFAEDATPSSSTRLVALQGINAFTDPGLYPLTLTAKSADGTVSTFEQLVPIASGDYPYQQLFVGPDQAGLLDQALVDSERELVLAAISTYTPERQWEGIFLPPVATERVTTGFGWRRSYNGGPYDSYHDGIDYGVPGGTIINAPVAGTVVFAGPMQVRGNTTIIDHGWGVYSSYWHQYRIYVQVGQKVQQGEALGEVGSTGLSTGSHLHFAIWVGGNAVDPDQWLSSVFP